MEDRCGVRTLGVLEERRVDRAGRVVEGQEDDPPAGPDRRGLGGHLDPGDEHLGLAAPARAAPGAGDPERVEHRVVEVEDVPAHVEAEHVELGPDPLGPGHLRQPGATDLRGVAEVEGELHVRRAYDGRGLGLPAGERPHPGGVGRRDRSRPRTARAREPYGGRSRSTARLHRSSSATWSSRSRRVTWPRRRTGTTDPMP